MITEPLETISSLGAELVTLPKTIPLPPPGYLPFNQLAWTNRGVNTTFLRDLIRFTYRNPDHEKLFLETYGHRLDSRVSRGDLLFFGKSDHKWHGKNAYGHYVYPMGEYAFAIREESPIHTILAAEFPELEVLWGGMGNCAKLINAREPVLEEF